MKDLKFEQKRSLSRHEAADRLTALADALRQGGEAELDLRPGTLSLRFPDNLRYEVEVEVGGGEIELEIEFTWSTAPSESAPPRQDSGTDQPSRRKPAPTAPDRGGTSTTKGTGTSKGTSAPKGTGTSKGTSTKRPAKKTA
ncbi:amphi-Trp domain-containing protein [Streptomyces sp. NPDC006624]|uniref:amphi-Trp domain-containing protein n=1 Tax=Streptomyces sp. NPDC006624 TaxID=3154892 RepID=UPI0033ACFE30